MDTGEQMRFNEDFITVKIGRRRISQNRIRTFTYVQPIDWIQRDYTQT